MTNFEKYKDDLMEIGGEFAFNKNTREIVRCNSCINCEDCIFLSGECAENYKIKWLYEEYKEPILSDDELELINVLSKINKKVYKYIGRDALDVIRLFETKPDVSKTGNYYGDYSMSGKGILFSNITHKDGLYDIENKCFIEV